MKHSPPPLSSFTDAERAQASKLLDGDISADVARMRFDLLWVDRNGSPIPIRMMDIEHKKFTMALWLRKYLEGQLLPTNNELDLGSTGLMYFDAKLGIDLHPVLLMYNSIRAIWMSLDDQEQSYVANHIVKDMTKVFDHEKRCVLFDAWESFSK